MKFSWLTFILSLLVCLLITAFFLVIIAYSKEQLANDALSVADRQQYQRNGIETSFTSWLKTGVILLFYLIFYGYWLLVIPGLVIFWTIVQRKPEPTNRFCLLLGLGVGLISSIVIYGLSIVLPPWSISPAKSSDWITLLMYGTVGAVYGLFYRKWLIT